MKKQDIEVEGGEILLMSKEGHYAVIPAKHRQEIMDMVKDGCDDCINSYIQSLPKESNYAQDGTLIPDDKKKIMFEPKPYTAVQDNTYVAPKVIVPLEQKKKQREQPVLKADTRTEQQRKIDQDYAESVLNPSISTQIGEVFQKPLRWLADPVKGVGDIVSAIAPNSTLAKDLPNTNEDVFEHRKKQLNPYTSNKEKINNTINEAIPLTNWALLNTLPIEAVAGNTIKAGKNLIKPASKVVNKVDDAVKLVERKQVFDEETLGAIERFNKYFGKDIPNNPLTLSDKVKIGRDVAAEKNLDRAYRNTHIDEIINAKKQGYFDNNRFPDTDWYYGGSSSKYGNIEVEAIPDSKYFKLFEVDGKYAGTVTPNKNILHLKGSNVPFKDVIVRYKGEVLTDDILEEISKQYKKGDNLDELIYSIKNKNKTK